VQVVGVSIDKPKLNRRWAARHDLMMPLISDPSRTISMAFGVAKWKGGVVARSTFLLEADGTVCKAYGQVSSNKGHAAAVLSDCRELWGST
jgi:peroxiredoxin Q/BCP